MLTFLIGSLETTPAFMPMLLYAFAKNPKIQDKARKEVDSIFANLNESSLSDVSKFEYTSCCIKEALRMYPPVPLTGRDITKPMEIDGKWIPPGLHIHIDIWQLHHNPAIWQDPFTFDPTRFSANNMEKIDPFAFIPFGGGQRKCIAQNFAMTVATVFAARILQEFEVSLPRGYEFRYDFCLTHTMKRDIPLIFSKRSIEEKKYCESE